MLLLVWKSEMFLLPCNEDKGEWAFVHQEEKFTRPPTKESERCCNFSCSQVIPENVMYNFSQMGWSSGISPWSPPNQDLSSR